MSRRSTPSTGCSRARSGIDDRTFVPGADEIDRRRPVVRERGQLPELVDGRDGHDVGERRVRRIGARTARRIDVERHRCPAAATNSAPDSAIDRSSTALGLGPPHDALMIGTSNEAA